MSAADYHKVGAAIFKGKSLISLGWNSTKTHPKSLTRYHAHHAEFAAIIGLHKYDLVGAEIFVTRLTPGGRISMAKPCSECERMIMAVGISKIHYTDYEGLLNSVRV